MPHEFVVGAFEPGDDDLGDFMLDIWLPFARDDCLWVDNQAPVVGTRPNIEVWTHRGTVPSPTAPFVGFHTQAQHMHTFNGGAVDLTEEVYDQPDNPSNSPADVSFTVPASGNIGTNMRTMLMNSVTGPYQGYWLFCDTSGSYIHCVLKVSARHYRHFHVGLLQQIDGGVDLNPESFYCTSSFWSGLDPEGLHWPTNPANDEHSPYSPNHMWPFRQSGGVSTNGAFGIARLNTAPPGRYYMPGLHPITLTSVVVNGGGTGHAVSDIITLSAFGSTGTPATVTVDAESAGVITAASLTTPGDYTLPHQSLTAIPQGASTGAGIDATFDAVQDGYNWYAAKPEAELLCNGSPANKAVGTINPSVNIGVCQTNGADSGLGSILWMCDANFTANANVLVPIYIAVNFDFQSDTRLGPVARVPDVFRINMRDYAPEQTITVQGVDYKVFPLMNDDAANVVDGEPYTGFDGFAYRVETGPVV